MFVGREEYLQKFADLFRKKTGSFVVVSGRRRIGKSTLVEEFARRAGCRFIELVGLPPEEGMTNERQIAHFCERLAVQTQTRENHATGWAMAFDGLEDVLKSSGKTIVFLDEISWMGRYDSSFAGLLKTAWDTQFSKHDQLVFVVAGSVSAWIHKNISRSHAFVGRISLDIALPELPISQCWEFWGKRIERLSTGEILDVLSITGGVPKYLQEIDPSRSADDNIRRLCFEPEGYLFNEFDRIFDDVFAGSAMAKKRILEVLGEGPASATELASLMGNEPNGHLSDDLSELAEAGFVVAAEGMNPQTGVRVREVRYRLRDNYTRFYLKFVLPRRTAIKEGFYRYTHLDRLPGWDAVVGLQFENLVLNNLGVLADLIGLKGRNVESAAPYSRRGGKSVKGVQVDLLIQLQKAVYVIEVKRRGKIGREVEDEVAEKVKRLSIPKGKSIRTVLVYEGDLAPEIEENGYFDYLVPASALLRMNNLTC